MPDYSFEEKAQKEGYTLVCGIDEAGRGPLAGPVCAAAVILPDGLEIEGLNDSKKISEKKRDLLFEIIKEKAIAFSIAFSDEKEIDNINILNATYRAMERAAESLQVPADFALIDGNRVPSMLKIPCESIIKGDSKSMSIAAASILAKVSRDRIMIELHKQYPNYNFLKHKGYGTKEHTENILKYGPCQIHRRSFLKKILKNE